MALAQGIHAEDLSINSAELNRYFLASLQSLQQQDYSSALRYLEIYASYGEAFFISYPHLFFYRGLAYYGLKEYEKAQTDWRTYLKYCPEDEMGHYHLGNVLLRQNDIKGAVDAYLEALKSRSSFAEVLFNANLVNEKLDQGVVGEGAENWLIQDSPFVSTLNIADDLDIWDIPIFINSFNRLGCLQRLVDWLLAAGYRRIYILDNASSYELLLKYYASLPDKAPQVQVVLLGQNMGHKALWDSGVLETLNIACPYVYTDSDVVPSEHCLKDVLRHLLAILRKYPYLKKVGLGLITEDITFFDAEKIQAQEQSFYLHEIEPELYFGAVDTTFALYRNYRHYNIYVAARTTGNYMARHLPWYYDYENLTEDEKYYIEHANASAGLIEDLKGRKLLKTEKGLRDA
ncbi:hypothetical protein, partial [Anaerovibrio sp.]|uniref:hypothetical protein n=1 Tax=Anaerovibrio sp. TaxID=1872532 RepID=UPI00388F68D8